MWKKLCDVCSGWKVTIISGVFLLFSLVLLLSGKRVALDPAYVTVLLSGYPLVYLALTRLIRQKWISSALLISIAMIASILIGELFAAGEVAFIMAIGALLEDMTVERAKKGIGKLVSLAPQQGRRVIDGREEIMPIEKIRKGDLLRVLPGETVPVDGTITFGSTSVDQQIMTGESLPVDRSVGDAVYCGTMNCFGSIDILATGVGVDTSLERMIALVKDAENRKSPMQRTVDRWATYLVPIALIIAVIGFIVTRDIVRAVTVLVVFCPCALALATPTAVMAAIGQATKNGVLIKSGEAIECMAKADCVAFDKTGTLTEGRLSVSDVTPFIPDLTPEALLTLAAAAEKRSEHPLGKAVFEHACAQGLALPEAEAFHMEPGKGVSAGIGGKQTLCGSEKYLSAQGVTLPKNGRAILDRLRGEGKATLIVSADGVCQGVIALFDTVRPSAASMVSKLRGMGSEVVLLTGDNERAARYLADRVGISDVRAELLPADKMRCIADWKAAGKRVCMIGDGVNDAPALKAADVSIAMGGMGSDIAIDAAGIALMGDDIRLIPYIKRLSVATLRTITGSITASMTINFIAIALSLLGLLTPVTGALVHNVGSVLIVMNAALLYDRKLSLDSPRGK